MDAPEEIKRQDGSFVRVGDRVESEGSHATVRYIGHVPPTQGVWLGVEWDDASRGKHDGTKDGKRYFNTLKQKAGSFVRPKKVSLGVPFLTALCDRYGLVDEEHAGVIMDEFYVRDSANRRTFIEMVGARDVNQKQSKLDQLLNVGLRGICVYGAGPGVKLKTATPNITELDLSKNLLGSWADVALLTEQLERLKSLDVSENRLKLPSNPELLQPAFKSLQTLFINRMQYSWLEVLQCCSMIPGLQVLHACFNEISELSAPGQHLSELELLNLESNQIHSWADLLHLGCLQSLQTLILNGNYMDSIYFPDTGPLDKTKLFPSLKSLSVNRNKIEKWRSINELNRLNELTELNARDNPFLQNQDEETGREFLIAKIVSLKLYSRTPVSPEERRGAEIDYLKKFGKDWLEAGGNQDPQKNNPSTEFLSEHPRYMQLVDAMGAPEDSEMKEESKTLKDSLISVKLMSPMSEKVLQKKLPLSMTVQKLKALVQRLFRVGSGNIQLSYLSVKMQGPEIELDNDLRQLSFYSIENDDTIKAVW